MIWRRDKRDEQSKELILLVHTAFARFSHWMIAFLLTLSIISGLWLGAPAIFGYGVPVRWLRATHGYVSRILAGLVLARAYYALVSRDIRHFLPRRGDLNKFVQLMTYYLFLKKEKPYEPTKYNVGQRWIYSSWFFAWLYQSVSGFILANPEKYVTVGKVFGDLQTIRFTKYLVTIYFVVTIFVHIYLSVSISPAKLQSIFTGYIRVKDGNSE